MGEYDLLLVYWLNRKHSYYINIVKQLGSKYKIGIFMHPDSANSSKRQAETDQLYLDELIKYGARLVEDKAACKILLAPVTTYNDKFINALKERVEYDELITYQFFTCQIEHIEDMKRKFVFKTLLAEDIKVLQRCLNDNLSDGMNDNLSDGMNDNLLDGMNDNLLDGINVVPVSFVCKDYPVFSDELAIDYLIVFPTIISFQKERLGEVDPIQKAKFIKNINKLLDKIGSENKVYYKLHTVRDGGNPFASMKALTFLNRLPAGLLPFINSIVCSLGLDKISPKMAKLVIALQFIFMGKKSKPLSEISPYHNFAVELFYPHVRKGIITGRSNSIWGALKSEIPVYNCDDNAQGSGYGEFTDHLRRNYECFGVPPCKGELKFDKNNFEKVRQDNSVDLIEFLEDRLSLVKEGLAKRSGYPS